MSHFLNVTNLNTLIMKSIILIITTLLLPCYSSGQIVLPFHTPNDSAYLSFEDFNGQLKEIEAKYQAQEITQTRLMITRLRKIFYSSPSYDRFLIKGAATIRPPYQQNIEITVPALDKTITMSSGVKIKLTDKITYPIDTVGNPVAIRQNIYTSQEVKVAPQMVSDIGHVLCGLDATTYPHAVEPPRVLGIQWTRIRVDKNIDAVTWIGDLGSAQAEVFFAKRLKKNKLNIDEEQKIVSNLASPADMLGNIDAYVIASDSFFGRNPKSVTTILNDFYYNQDPHYQQLRKERYLIFSKKIGLHWDGTRFNNYQERLDYYTDQVNDSAALYAAISAKRNGKWNTIKALPMIFRLSRQRAYAQKILILFFDELTKQIINSK